MNNPSPLKVYILGQSSLALTTIECCRRANFDISCTSRDCDVLWICYDTPLDDNDLPDNQWVVNKIVGDLASTNPNTLVLISSQLPVGTTATLEKLCPAFSFAHSPENIRVKFAIADFLNQKRVVVGRRTEKHDGLIRELFRPFTSNIILTDPETAEMVKHSLNCYLGVTIAFANEIARVSAAVGADMGTITKALLAERRVSPDAPLHAGPPFGGGHLAREFNNMARIANENGLRIPIIDSVLPSNAQK
jgi:UDPglucose 6-dehydrogenase